MIAEKTRAQPGLAGGGHFQEGVTFSKLRKEGQATERRGCVCKAEALVRLHLWNCDNGIYVRTGTERVS